MPAPWPHTRWAHWHGVHHHGGDLGSACRGCVGASAGCGAGSWHSHPPWGWGWFLVSLVPFIPCASLRNLAPSLASSSRSPLASTSHPALPRTSQHRLKPAQQRVLLFWVSRRFPAAFPSFFVPYCYRFPRQEPPGLCTKMQSGEQREMSPSAHLLSKGLAACAQPLLHTGETTTGRGCSDCPGWLGRSHGHLLPPPHPWDRPAPPSLLVVTE